MKITIMTDPVPQARVRFGKGRVFLPARSRAYQDEIAMQARQAMGERPILQSPVSVAIRLYRHYKSTARKFGDVDNHLKAIFDALTGVVFKDDSQVVACAVYKFTDSNPRVEIEKKESDQNEFTPREIC